MTMGGSPEEARARADAKFQKQQEAAEAGAKATEERAAQARAVDVNTARLKSLRLAKEAADKEASQGESERSRPPAARTRITRRTPESKEAAPIRAASTSGQWAVAGLLMRT